MRSLVLLDKAADRKHVDRALEAVADIYKTNTGMECVWSFEERDFTDIRFEDYYGGNFGIDRAGINRDAAAIWEAWRHEIDNVIYLVTDENWQPGRMPNRIWGWNLGRPVSHYNIQQCRIDPRNVANTIGTVYHEMMHCKDNFILAMKGIDINRLGLPWSDWDESVVHGKGSQWQYIRHMENQAALKLIAPHLVRAVEKRKALFEEHTDLQRQIIQLAERAIVLYREAILLRGEKPVACRPGCCLFDNH